MPSKSIDLIFADPPYNLSGEGKITVQSGERVECDKGSWDKIEDYESFTEEWITECKRVLKDDGTIWISGTLHNAPYVGVALKKLGFWIINDITWYKPNAPPLISANRLAPATERIWLAGKSKDYYFNYGRGKELRTKYEERLGMREGKQMRNLWIMTAEEHKTDHPTEKPEKLLERILTLGSKEGDFILDPFLGSGTTGVVSKKLNRNFKGIEIKREYVEMARERIRKQEEPISNFLQ